MFATTLLFLGKIGPGQVIVIVVLFLLLFGGKKIPEMMRGMGRGVKEFKDAVNKDYSVEDESKTTKEEVDNSKQIEK